MDRDSIIGIRVIHKSKYGEGIIENLKGDKIQVRFLSGYRTTFPLSTMGNGFLEVATNESEKNKQLICLITEEGVMTKAEALFFKELEDKYGFEGFVHYTAYDNLESILDSGYLMSRNQMLEEKIDWVDLSYKSVIADTSETVKNCTRFLYGFNTPISYRFEQNAIEKGTEAVAIVFDKSIACKYNSFFFEKSAARDSYGTPVSRILDMKNFNWNEIFNRWPMNYNKTEKKQYRDAEMVIPDKVSIDYINTIYFRSPEYYIKAVAEFGDDSKFRLGKIGKRKHFSEGI